MQKSQIFGVKVTLMCIKSERRSQIWNLGWASKNIHVNPQILSAVVFERRWKMDLAYVSSISAASMFQILARNVAPPRPTGLHRMCKNRDNLLKSADVTGRSWSTEEKHYWTEPVAGSSLFFFATLIWPRRVGVSMVFYLVFSTPHPHRCPYSIRAALSPVSPGEQGECGVFPGSKIYEQLKSQVTPSIGHLPGHTAARLGWWWWWWWWRGVW